MVEAIAALTAQITVIITQVKNLASTARNNPAATTSASTYVMTTGQMKVEDITDCGNKVCLNLWKAAIEVLLTKFDMEASGMATFVEGMKAKAQEFGWSEGSK